MLSQDAFFKSHFTYHTFYFDWHAPVKTIHIAGYFNNWLDAENGLINTENPVVKNWQFRKGSDGRYFLPKAIAEEMYGQVHEIKYLIDGQWYPKGGPETNLKLLISKDGMDQFIGNTQPMIKYQ